MLATVIEVATQFDPSPARRVFVWQQFAPSMRDFGIEARQDGWPAAIIHVRSVLFGLGQKNDL